MIPISKIKMHLPGRASTSVNVHYLDTDAEVFAISRK
jgi:hypothetical protein